MRSDILPSYLHHFHFAIVQNKKKTILDKKSERKKITNATKVKDPVF